MKTSATIGMRILAGCLLVAFMTAGTLHAQEIIPPDEPDDLADLPMVFNVDTDEIDWEGYTMFPFAGAGLARIENPDKSGLNVTDHVIQYGKYGGDPWAGFFYHTDGPIELTDESTFRLNVWSPRADIQALLKLEMRQFPDVNTGDMFVPITVASEWTQLEWDLSEVDRDTPFDRVVIIMDLQGPAGDGSPGFIWYLDDFAFQAVSTSIDNSDPSLPRSITLDQNYPNPFNPSTTITFSLAQPSQATLAVYDLLGQKVATLAEEMLPAGQHSVDFTPSDLPSGVYFYRLQAGSEVRTRTLTLIK